MSTPTTDSAAALVAAAGLPTDTPVKALPGLTFHVTKPLEKADPPILTIGDLAALADDELVQIPQFGPARLHKVKAALLAASGATS